MLEGMGFNSSSMPWRDLEQQLSDSKGSKSFITSEANSYEQNPSNKYISQKLIFGGENKTITWKFGAKASFEVWSIGFYVVFCEESEIEVKNGPEPLKNQQFSNKTQKKSMSRGTPPVLSHFGTPRVKAGGM